MESTKVNACSSTKQQRQQAFLKSSRLLDHETFIQQFKNHEQPDAELIEEYYCNHNRAFEKLYKRYRSKMLAYIYTLVHDNNDTQDVLHNAWERVLIAFKNQRYEEKQDFEGWFKAICYREARLWNIEKRRFLHGREFMPDKPDSSLSIEHQIINKETEYLLRKAINFLDERSRQLMILHAWEGRSFYEISVIMDIKVNLARMYYSRALKKIKRITEFETFIS